MPGLNPMVLGSRVGTPVLELRPYHSLSILSIDNSVYKLTPIARSPLMPQDPLVSIEDFRQQLPDLGICYLRRSGSESLSGGWSARSGTRQLLGKTMQSH